MMIATDKNSILEVLSGANRHVGEWFNKIPANDFFTRQPGRGLISMGISS
jgi:hypothetical protein